jgi:hypothetical protein
MWKRQPLLTLTNSMTTFLALKAVNADNQSAFVTNPMLRMEYEVGKTVRARHTDFPLYLATWGNISEGGLSLAISTAFDKVLLVSVEEKHLKTILPFSHFINVTGAISLSEIMKSDNFSFNEHYTGTTELTVLEEVPDYGDDLFVYLEKQSKMRHLPILKHFKRLG